MQILHLARRPSPKSEAHLEAVSTLIPLARESWNVRTIGSPPLVSTGCGPRSSDSKSANRFILREQNIRSYGNTFGFAPLTTVQVPVQMLLESTTYAYVDLVWVANTRSISAVLPAPVSTNRRLRSCLLTLVVMVVMTELFQFSRIISLLGMKQIDRISTLCESTHIRGAAVYYKLNTKE